VYSFFLEGKNKKSEKRKKKRQRRLKKKHYVVNEVILPYMVIDFYHVYIKNNKKRYI
jgi:hypothetical protein